MCSLHRCGLQTTRTMLAHIAEYKAFYAALIARLRIALGKPQLAPTYTDGGDLPQVQPSHQALSATSLLEARRSICRALVCLGDLCRLTRPLQLCAGRPEANAERQCWLQV